MDISKKTIGILTLGCKVNQYESEALGEELERRGYRVVSAGGFCDAYVVNTCTVTAEADRKSRQMIRRLHAQNPAAPIIVTGCTAQTSPDAVAALPGVAAVCGNSSKMLCADLLDRALPQTVSFLPDIHVAEPIPARFEPMRLDSFPRTRVYIKIEDGCENRCAYCAIPGARGPVRSKTPEDVLTEVGGFCRAGCREIVLTGIETASYGRDLPGVTLTGLLRQVCGICGDCRIRLGSLEPSLFRPDFVGEIAALPQIAPHFHISLQSGSSATLAAMRRKYTAEGAMAAVERLRAAIPGVMLTADVIVGFPGEDEAAFEQTLDFIRKAGFLRVHVFPFSARRGTPAAVMPEQVPVAVRRARAAALSAEERRIRGELLDGEIARNPYCEVLFETYSDGYAAGHTPSFIEVRAKSAVNLHGLVRRVKLTGHDGEVCTGIIDEVTE